MMIFFFSSRRRHTRADRDWSSDVCSSDLKKKKTKPKNYFYLTSKSNLDEAAKNLYSCLRKIKNEGYKSIAVEKIPNIGLGKAINDRLRRASKY